MLEFDDEPPKGLQFDDEAPTALAVVELPPIAQPAALALPAAPAKRRAGYDAPGDYYLEPSLTAIKTDEELQAIIYPEARQDLKDHDLARWLLLEACGRRMARIDPPHVAPFWFDQPIAMDPLQKALPAPEPHVISLPDRAAAAAEAVEEAHTDQIGSYLATMGIQRPPDESDKVEG